MKELHTKKRMANMELLRILAMMMVVMLHFLSKGELLPEWTGTMNMAGYTAWLLEAFSIVAVNVYMLISGYFLVEAEFKCRRLLQIVLQTVFYTILIPVCMVAAGMLQPSDITIYKLLQYFLPVQMGHHWFISAYVLMYLFTPFLNVAVKHMKKSQLQITLVFLLLLLSCSKSLVPARLEMDQRGNDGVWFLCVYLIAAYIRLYGIPFFKNGTRSLLVYLTSTGAIFCWAFGFHLFYRKTGILEDFIHVSYDYNHLLCLLASVALFYAFWFVRIKDGIIAKWICKIAPYTLGVYLLHEQIEVRYLWPGWLGADKLQSVPAVIFGSLGSVAVVFIIGIFVDMLRGAFFQGVGRLLKGSAADRLCDKLDGAVNGR